MDLDQVVLDLNLSDCISQTSSLSELIDQYEKVANSVMDLHAPLRTKRFNQKQSKPWYDTDVAKIHKSVRLKELSWRKKQI